MPFKITLLGPLPPPFGGVSIHIIRFMELVEAEGLQAEGIRYTGTTRQGRLGKLLQAVRMLWGIYRGTRIHPGDTLHVHYGGFGYYLAIMPLLKRSPCRKVITFHSVRVLKDLEGRPAWLQKKVIDSLNAFDLFVPVREGIGQEMKEWKLDVPETIVMPAFLPPASQERDLDRLPAEVQDTLTRNQAAGRMQVCAAAYYLGPGYGQDDLYGIEELVGALEILDRNLKAPLDVWVLSSNAPETPAQKAAQQQVLVAGKSLKHITLQLHYGLPLIPVMARCGAFLRPSREDGDSVAIREAMSMGLPVLASDVVNRPEGVQVFEMGDPAVLAAALAEFLPTCEPVPVGEARAILEGEKERFRAFVQKVAGIGGQAAAR